MTKSLLIAKLDCRELDLRVLVEDLSTDVQMAQSDETSRALRQLRDSLGQVLSRLGLIATAARDLNEW